MKRTLASLVLPALSLVSGCDGAATGRADAGAADLTMTRAPDLAKSPDLATIEVPGSRLATGTLHIVGVTADELVIAYDMKAGSAVAVPFGGGAPREVNKLPDQLQIDGKVVFAGAALDQFTHVGEIWVWSAAGGSKLLDASSLALASASEDGAWIAWSGNAAMDGSSTDLFVGKGDGSGAIKVFSGVLVSEECYPDFAFHGGTLLVSHCAPGGEGRHPCTRSIRPPAWPRCWPTSSRPPTAPTSAARTRW